MEYFLKHVFRVAFLFSIGTLYSQTIWHVATTGSDSLGDGTDTDPYATLQKAADQVSAGDMVYVHEGTYQNIEFDNGDIWNTDTLLKIVANGTENNNIIFMPFPGDDVLLEFDATYGVLIKNSSYITFSGFEIKGIGDQITQSEADAAWGLYKDNNGLVHDLAEELDIDINDPNLAGTIVDKPSTPDIDKPSYYNGRGIVANSSHHITITNNMVRNTPSSAIRSQQSDYVTISNNMVYDNTFWTTQGVGAITVAESTVKPSGDTFTGVKIILEKNDVHHNENRMISWNPTKTFVNMVIDEGTGLFLTRNKDTYDHGYILIANNISAYNGASGIVSHVTDRVIIEHNTCYKNGTTNDSAAGGIGVNNVDDITIRNNISYAEPNHWALGILANPITNMTISNNILYNESGSETIHHNISSGWIEINPLLTNPENKFFTLTSPSPAIDAGSIDSLSTDDFDGNPRDDGIPDIGAYEYDENLSTDSFVCFNWVKVSPNPTSSSWNVQVKKGLLLSIEIYDLLGKQVFFKANINTTSYSITTGFVQKGVYFSKIQTTNGVTIFKLLRD